MTEISRPGPRFQAISKTAPGSTASNLLRSDSKGSWQRCIFGAYSEPILANLQRHQNTVFLTLTRNASPLATGFLAAVAGLAVLTVSLLGAFRFWFRPDRA